jgi:CHASE3 domain sensor protein
MKRTFNYLSSFFLLKEGRTMNKTQKALAILLLIAAVVFVAGCSSQSSTQKTTDNTGSPAEEHPDQSKEWMQKTSSDAENISSAANELATVLSNPEDLSQITTLTTYIITESNKSSYESAFYYYDDDLEPAVQKYADMMGSYGAFAKRIDMSIEHINAGNTASAEITIEDAAESLTRGNTYYEEYKAMIADFKKDHPETA